MLLLDVGEESWVGEIPFPTWTPKFTLSLLFVLHDGLYVLTALLFAHCNYKSQLEMV